jgi:carnitine-CoA ligase
MTVSPHAAAVIAASRMTVGETVIATAVRQPDSPCLVLVGGSTLTYRQLVLRASVLARGLYIHGVRPNDRVAILSPSRVEVIQSWLAINMLGAIEVTVNPAWTGSMLLHALSSSRATHVIVDAGLQSNVLDLLDGLSLTNIWVLQTESVPASASLPSPRDVMPGSTTSVAPFDDLLRDGSSSNGCDWEFKSGDSSAAKTASIVYTSGTSGRAKGVLMSHGQICAVAASTVHHMRLGRAEIFYCIHPLFHMAGKFMACLATFMSGGCLILDQKFSANEWLSRIRKYKATRSLAHGPMLEMVYQTEATPLDGENPLELLASAPFPKKIAKEFQTRFNVEGIECWGMTEVGLPLWTTPASGNGSCGRCDSDLYELKIVEPGTTRVLPAGQAGEAVIRSVQPLLLMNGYDDVQNALISIENSDEVWFRTGDIMLMEPQGDYYFLDRATDRIRRRAENISSYEIEAAAVECGATAAAAVGVDSGFEQDDDIKLCVVIATWEPAQLLRRLSKRLPHYMLPRYIERYDALPRTPTNKVRKSELRKIANSEFSYDRHEDGISIKALYGS